MVGKQNLSALARHQFVDGYLTSMMHNTIDGHHPVHGKQKHPLVDLPDFLDNAGYADLTLA